MNRTYSSLSKTWVACLLFGMALLGVAPNPASAQSLQQWVDESCPECASLMESRTGVYILEKGEEALIGRAWLTQHATTSIDIQYFIFSLDNVGIIALDYLLRAADRGVNIRMLVDDIMLDVSEADVLALNAHPNLEIRIYNPSPGKNGFQKAYHAVTDFQGFNQRMHNKTFIVDRSVAITGGRNIADEYFDYDQEYNFLDFG